MNIEVLADSGAVAERATSIIVDVVRDAISARGACVMAVSGGHTPWAMLRRLAVAPIPGARQRAGFGPGEGGARQKKARGQDHRIFHSSSIERKRAPPLRSVTETLDTKVVGPTEFVLLMPGVAKDDRSIVLCVGDCRGARMARVYCRAPARTLRNRHQTSAFDDGSRRIGLTTID